MVVIMEKLISSDIPEFEDIRPYHDGEVREVIARLMKDKEFISVLARGLIQSQRYSLGLCLFKLFFAKPRS
jgi:hypothetical protein